MGAIAVDAAGAIHISDAGGSISVDDGGNVLTVDGTVNLGTIGGTATEVTLDAVKTAVESLQTAIGTDGAAGPASALSIGGTETGGNLQEIRVDADGHLQVDVLSGGGGGTQYTEDDVAPANPVGTATALVREDAPVSIAADGDIVAQRATQYGAAYVQILDSSGNYINTFGGSGGTSHADDAAFTIGSAGSITPAGYLADETSPSSVDEGDVGVPRMTLSRKPYAVITDATSENNAAVDGSGHLQIDIAADSAGLATQTTLASVLTQTTITASNTQTIADAIGTDNVAGPAQAMSIAGTETGGNLQEIRVDADGHLQADILTIPAVTNAGTFAVQEDGAALTALQLIDDAVHTDDAAYTLGADKGVMIMGFAGTQLVDANDAAALACDTAGHLQIDVAGELPAGTQNIGDVDVATIAAGANLVGDVGIGVRTSGGATPGFFDDVDETADTIKGSAGMLYSLHVMNLTNAVLWLQVYNHASPTVGTTTPLLRFPILTPGDTNGSGFVWSSAQGAEFGTAITIACTTTRTGSAGPAANSCIVNYTYQ